MVSLNNVWRSSVLICFLSRGKSTARSVGQSEPSPLCGSLACSKIEFCDILLQQCESCLYACAPSRINLESDCKRNCPELYYELISPSTKAVQGTVLAAISVTKEPTKNSPSETIALSNALIITVSIILIVVVMMASITILWKVRLRIKTPRLRIIANPQDIYSATCHTYDESSAHYRDQPASLTMLQLQSLPSGGRRNEGHSLLSPMNHGSSNAIDLSPSLAMRNSLLSPMNHGSSNAIDLSPSLAMRNSLLSPINYGSSNEIDLSPSLAMRSSLQSPMNHGSTDAIDHASPSLAIHDYATETDRHLSPLISHIDSTENELRQLSRDAINHYSPLPTSVVHEVPQNNSYSSDQSPIISSSSSASPVNEYMNSGFDNVDGSAFHEAAPFLETSYPHFSSDRQSNSPAAQSNDDLTLAGMTTRTLSSNASGMVLNLQEDDWYPSSNTSDLGAAPLPHHVDSGVGRDVLEEVNAFSFVIGFENTEATVTVLVNADVPTDDATQAIIGAGIPRDKLIVQHFSMLDYLDE